MGTNLIQYNGQDILDAKYSDANSILQDVQMNLGSVTVWGGTETLTSIIRDVYLDSDSDTVTIKTLLAPAHETGDLIVAVIMSRESNGGLSAPNGWLLKGQYCVGLDSQQTLSVYYKIATDSEPVSYNFSNTNPARICGTIFSTNAKSIQEVKEALSTPSPTEGQYTTSITVDPNELNFFVSTWVYANDGVYTTSNFSGVNFPTVNDVGALNTRLNCTYSTEASNVTFQTENFSDLPDGIINAGSIAIKLSLDSDVP